MTLPKLRKLADKAKAWRPDRRRFCPKASSVYMNGWGCGCDACLCAQRAVEWIVANVESSLGICTRLGDALRNTPLACKWAINDARLAARIESLFGSPGPVAAFEAGVREMCNG